MPMSVYELPEFRVIVFFSDDPLCSKPRSWRVPPGTVVSLSVSPAKEIRPSEIGIDLTTYQSTGERDIVGAEGYENRETGISLELFKGFIQGLIFSPTDADEPMRCKPLKTLSKP
jgi:hypothetical protein